MFRHLPICYQAPRDCTDADLPRGRGHLLLLHIDVADVDLVVVRVWPDATVMDACRMARHPSILHRLCPFCLSS
jgi:hypothetical protein